jgi:hypothetical protein
MASELDEMTGTDDEGLSSDLYDAYEDHEPVEPRRFGAPGNGMRPVSSVPVQRGIATSPLFQQAAQFPQASQLGVYKLREGRPYSLGAVGLNATQEEFIKKYSSACPGQFLLRPMDDIGGFLGDEFTFNVDEGHPAIGGNDEATPQVGIPGDASRVALDLLREQIMTARMEQGRLRETIEAERQVLAEERSEIAQERVAMASQAANAVASQTERQMAYSNDQANQMITTLTGIFQQQQAQTQQMMAFQGQAHEQLMERMRAQDTEDRTRREDSQERERERARREEKGRRHDQEVTMQREREYHLRLRDIEKSNSGLGAVKKLLGDFGMEPKDVLAKMMDGGGQETGMGSAIVGAVADVAKSFAANAAEAAKSQAQVQQRQIEMAALLQAQQEGGLPPDEDEHYLELPDHESEPEPPQAGSPQAVLDAFREGPETPTDPTSGLPLQVQKRARVAVRSLVRELGASPEPGWAAKVAVAVNERPEILDYIRAVSIRVALSEGGASPDLAGAIIAAVDQTGLLPADIPRG